MNTTARFLDWRRPTAALFAVVGFGVLVASLNQPVEYDEAITVLIAGGNGAVVWPKGITDAAAAQMLISKTRGVAEVLKDVRDTDVHPPLHYLSIWLLQSITGPNILFDRILSLVAIVIGLFAWLAVWRRHIDDSLETGALFAAVYLSIFGVYYMGTTARGYALASVLLSIAFTSLLRLFGPIAAADRPLSNRPSAWICLAIGLPAGLAVLANYLAGLAAFVIVAIAFIACAAKREWRHIALLVIGASPPVAIASYFFLFQIGTRPDHLAGFVGVFGMVRRMVPRMLFYVPDEIPPNIWQIVVLYPLLGIALVGCVMVIVRREIGYRAVVLAGLVVVSYMAGLILLSVGTDKTLSEARYMALTAPFLAVVLTFGISLAARAGRMKSAMATLPFLLVAAHLAMTIKIHLGPGVQEWTKIARRASETTRGEALLIIDQGYGRGVPAAVALSASPQTRILIAKLADITKPDILKMVAENKHVHVALSPKSRLEGKSDLLDKHFRSMGYRMKIKSRYYRYFTQ